MHGDRWMSVEANNEDFIKEILPTICKKGRLAGKNIFSHELEDVAEKSGTVFGLSYLDSPVNFMALIVSGIEEGANLLWSAYPVCADGIEYKFTIEKVLPFENGIEGIVKVAVPDGCDISFFDPYFFLNKDHYRVGELADIALCALAYSLHKSEQLELDISQGPLLELHRQRLLEKGSSLDVSTITSVPLSMDGAAIYLPKGEDADDAELRFKVEEIFQFDCAGRPFHRLTGVVMRPDEREVKIHVYVSDAVLDGYQPQIGDNVEGVVWLQGFLSGSH